jgi:hypothetical protein
MFSLKTHTQGGARTHHIEWPVRPIDPQQFNELATWFKQSVDYAPPSAQSSDELAAKLDKIRAPHDGAMISVEQAGAIRNVVIKEKIIKNFRRINMQISRIAKKYASGTCITMLSAQYDFPPLSLLRGIFLHMKYDPAAIYSVFANKKDPRSALSGRDLAQYNMAEKGDVESIFNQQASAELAAANEKTFVDYFVSLGIELYTQDMLAETQNKEYGRAVLTPDILFKDQVFINGMRVWWIDYKDYIGTNIKFLLASNMKQAAKYANEWGPGAICYHYSFVSDVSIPGAMMLDVSALPLKLIDKN